MQTLLIATRNRHKVGEIRAILGEDFRFLTLDDFPAAPAVSEDAHTFAGNAALKAEALARWVAANTDATEKIGSTEQFFVLADDSGLEVDALNGAPGVHSARFAAMDTGASGNSSDAANNAKLLRLLAAKPDAPRTARFRCVIALATVKPAGPTRFFEGACEGTIESAARGAGGFGYDPLFIPRGFRESFAELGEEIKNRISHRAQALAKLKEAF
jgi:XTP/dITP diphosphohydrolase